MEIQHPFSVFKKGLRPTNIITALVIGFWLMVLIYAWRQPIPRVQYGVLFLGGATILYLATEAHDAFQDRDWLDIALLAMLALATVTVTGYMVLNFEALFYFRSGFTLPHEYILGGIFIIVVTYLTGREFGLAFVVVLLIAFAYAYGGQYFPGMLQHSGFEFDRIITALIWQYEGFFGNITRIIAAWVAPFILYAGLLRGYGAFNLIMRMSFKSADYIRSGVAQSAVIASLIMGTITGSPSANTAMTGSITIPMIKESGIKSKTSGAIEAVASSGGQIMPPIMGAAAFLMASFLGMRYMDIIIAGFLPAMIFYISVVIAVHYTALRQINSFGSTVSMQFDDSMTKFEYISDGVKFGVPFFLLLYLLGIANWTIGTAALFTCIAMIATGTLVPILESTLKSKRKIGTAVKEVIWDTVEGLQHAATIMAPIAIIVAAVNGVVDLLVLSGMPGKFSLALIEFSGGMLILAAILAMIVCIILGMGMPSVAAYSIVALLIAPSLQSNYMLNELSVHFFVFYSAILANLTPPIAVSVVIAAGIAGANFWRTSWEAIKIALPLFLLPFVFLYNPEIVVGGLNLITLISSFVILLGATTISYGVNSSHVKVSERWGISKLSIAVRFLFILSGAVTMVYPGWYIRIASVIFGLVLIAVFSPLSRTWVSPFVPGMTTSGEKGPNPREER